MGVGRAARVFQLLSRVGREVLGVLRLEGVAPRLPDPAALPGARVTSAYSRKLNRFLLRAGFPIDWYLLPLAAAIGSVAGLVAQLYGRLVRSSEAFFFERIAEHNFSGARVWLVLALPMAGGLLVGAIKTFYRLPLISHGIPEVIRAIARNRGRLTLRSGLFTAVNSAITLGSGGSTGQEGPIVHIGSVVGSKIGQVLRVNREHMDTLIGCGAAGGIAAIFGTPIAGVFLVLEVLLRDFSSKTFMPIIIAAVFAVAANQAVAAEGLGHAGHGRSAALFVLDRDLLDYSFTFAEIVPYLLLGVACGVAGWVFTRTLQGLEHAWTRLRWPKPVKPIMGGLILGGMGLIYLALFPRLNAMSGYEPPAFFGNGYPVIAMLLTPSAYAAGGELYPLSLTLGFLMLTAFFKVLGTGMTLGSGGSGGIFAPCLFLGASFGGGFGVLVRQTGLFPGIGPAAYALAGMAGVLSAAVRCPLTAFIMVFELTHDYKVVLPVMLVAIAATIVAQLLMRDSIYTAVLREMGVRVGGRADLTLLRRIEVAKVPLMPAVMVYPHDPLQRLLDLAQSANVADYVVTTEAEQYLGMVVRDDVRTALLQHEAVPLMIVGELMRTDLPTVTRDQTLDEVLDLFSRHEVDSLAVVGEKGKVLGLITRSRLMWQYQQSLARE